MPHVGLLPPRLARALLAVYWAGLLVLMHFPVEVQERGRTVPVDKLVHLAAYGILAVLAAVVIDGLAAGPSRFAARGGWKSGVALVALVAAHGLLDEWTQPWTGRDFDWWDAAADAVGAAAAVAAYTRLMAHAPRDSWGQAAPLS